MEVEVYKKQTNAAELQRRANDIFAKYFDPDSIYEVNVPSKICEELKAEMQKQQATPTLFNNAQRAVFEMMELDSWERYIHDEMFEQFKADMKKKREEAKATGSKINNKKADDKFFMSMYESFHDMLVSSGGNKRKLFATESTQLLEELIKRHQIQEQPAPLPLKSSSNKRQSQTAEGNDDSNNTQQNSHMMLKHGILANMLIPLHGVVGALTVSSGDLTETMKSSNAKFLSQHFEFGDKEKVISTFHCAYRMKANMLAQGRLYISNKKIYFYANILGKEIKKSEHFKNIVSIEKAFTAVVLPNAIEIHTLRGKKMFFSSFLNRESCYTKLEAEWKRVKTSKEEKN